MPPRVQKEYLIQLRDDEHLEALMNAEVKKLLVIDVFLDWCGPCILLEPVYKSTALKIEEWDKRLQFLQGSVHKVRSLAKYQDSAKPKFLVFLVSSSQGSKLITIIDGVNVPLLIQTVNRYVPSLED